MHNGLQEQIRGMGGCFECANSGKDKGVMQTWFGDQKTQQVWLGNHKDDVHKICAGNAQPVVASA